MSLKQTYTDHTVQNHLVVQVRQHILEKVYSGPLPRLLRTILYFLLQIVVI